MISDPSTMMGGSGGVMWGIGLGWLLVALVLVLGVAALIKYLFFSNSRKSSDG